MAVLARSALHNTSPQFLGFLSMRLELRQPQKTSTRTKIRFSSKARCRHEMEMRTDCFGLTGKALVSIGLDVQPS